MKIKKVFLTLFLIAVFVVPAFSVDFILGVKSGYYVWEPYLDDISVPSFTNLDRGTGMLYGPVASVIITNDLSFSVAALFGKQSIYWSSEYTQYANGGGLSYITGTYSFEAPRFDLDSALSYRFLKNYKVFLGYKYWKTDATLSYTEYRTDASKVITAIYAQKAGLDMYAHGPALGIGYAHTLGNIFFFALNISGVYMKGSFKVKGDYQHSYDNSLTYSSGSSKGGVEADTVQYGLNFEPTVGFTSLNNTIITTLGLRYQYLATMFEGIQDPEFKQDLKETDDRFYGIYVSILYKI